MARRVCPSFTPLPPLPPATGRGAVCMTIKVDRDDVLIARVTAICVPHVRLVYSPAAPSTRQGGVVMGCVGATWRESVLSALPRRPVHKGGAEVWDVGMTGCDSVLSVLPLRPRRSSITLTIVIISITLSGELNYRGRTSAPAGGGAWGRGGQWQINSSSGLDKPPLPPHTRSRTSRDPARGRGTSTRTLGRPGNTWGRLGAPGGTVLPLSSASLELD